MKVLVTYYTQTGNTEKLARAIYDVLTTDKTILPVADVKSLDGYHLVLCGFPVQAHSVAGQDAGADQKASEGQKVAFFATHGSLRGSQLAKQAFASAEGLAVNLTVLGQFGCRGRVEDRLIGALMSKPEAQGVDRGGPQRRRASRRRRRQGRPEVYAGDRGLGGGPIRRGG